MDPRFLPTGGTITVTIDGERSFSLAPAADGYAYSDPADDEALLTLMRDGLVMTVQIAGTGAPIRRIEVSLLGFTRATDAVRAACATPE